MNSEERPVWKRVVTIVLPLLGLVFVAQSTYSIYNLARRSDVVEQERRRLKQLEKEQEELKTKLSQSYTSFFIEEEARNKLGLLKPGETLVYLEKEATEAGTQMSGLKTGEKAGQNQEKTILQQWWDVFF